mmetsp:Transcript_31340/g.86154  ORF Transcript_31340/g.86154 Transcript_31340/m.86154 type:complete len:268 (+) Transcript_31340:1264-2067(+)
MESCCQRALPASPIGHGKQWCHRTSHSFVVQDYIGTLQGQGVRIDVEHAAVVGQVEDVDPGVKAARSAHRTTWRTRRGPQHDSDLGELRRQLVGDVSVLRKRRGHQLRLEIKAQDAVKQQPSHHETLRRTDVRQDCIATCNAALAAQGMVRRFGLLNTGLAARDAWQPSGGGGIVHRCRAPEQPVDEFLEPWPEQGGKSSRLHRMDARAGAQGISRCHEPIRELVELPLEDVAWKAVWSGVVGRNNYRAPKGCGLVDGPVDQEVSGD